MCENLNNEELIMENNNMLNELFISEKCFELLSKYRRLLIKFSNNCSCDQLLNINEFKALENDFKFISNNNKSNYSSIEPNVQISEIPIDKKNRHIFSNNKIKSGLKSKKQLMEKKGKVVVKQEMSNDSFDGNKCDAIVMNRKRLSKEVLLFKIRNNEVETDIDENNDMIKVFRPMVTNNFKRKGKKVYGYGCNWTDCQYINAEKHRISVHIKAKHTFEQPFSCMDCDFKTTTNKNLNQHIFITHNDNNILYKCDFTDCKFETKNQWYLKTHKDRHNKVKPYKCVWPSCEGSFVTSGDLTSHMSVHTDQKPYSCQWPGCDATFSKKQNLKCHERTHTGEKPYVCDWPNCGLSFAVYCGLSRHKLNHTGYSAVCDWPQCGKKFSDNYKLKRHQMIHSNEKPFKCAFSDCDRRFTEYGLMLRHYKSHKTLLFD